MSPWAKSVWAKSVLANYQATLSSDPIPMSIVPNYPGVCVGREADSFILSFWPLGDST